jgi:predicted Zn-dependent peptidase
MVIMKQTLHNGLRIVAEPIPYVRSIALGIWIGTGSENETVRENGISHFMEHMMFKGTRKRTARQLAESFDEIGGHVNAFTSKEITCYYVKVLDQHFKTCLEILSDMFFESILAENEIEKEKKVIIEEIRMVEDTPDDLVHDLLLKASMGSHSLGYPVLGSIENVGSFTREDLLSYQQRFYHPYNVVIALAGNLPDDFLEQVASIFSRHQGEDRPMQAVVPIFTPQMEVKQKSTEQTHLCLGLPGLPLHDLRMYTLILLNNVLGGNMSSRLFQQIREERGLAYSVFSYHSAYRHAGLLVIYAGTAHGQQTEVIECIQQILDQMQQQGLTVAELSKAKEQLKGNLMLGLESTNNRMNRLGRNELLLGRHLSLDETVEMIERVTLDEVNALAQQIFSSPMSLALISPDEQVPSSFRGNSLV